MEGKGPYRIYDPGGSEVKARDEAVGGSSYRQLLEENSMLRERMKGLKSLGMLCMFMSDCCQFKVTHCTLWEVFLYFI